MTLERVGLIAGSGALPLRIAAEVVERGHPIVAVAFPGITQTSLEEIVEDVHWVKLGKLDEPISVFKSKGVVRVLMAGKIDKGNLMRPWKLGLDMRALRLIRSLKDWKDDTVLAAIAAELAKDGLVVDEITPWATKLMAPLGVLTKRAPADKQWKDIEFGREMARGIGALDIGQTVVVKNSAVVVVEAIEGTDKAIRRVTDIGVTDGVVVKMAKPDQDMRFDVPGVGPSTVDSMIAAKAAVLAIEAHKTMVTDSDETIEKADRAGISIVGIPAEGPLR